MVSFCSGQNTLCRFVTFSVLPPGRESIGELVVQVPEGVSVRVVASSGLGEVQALGKQESGVVNRVDTTAEAGGDRRLELDLRVGIGQVRVER